MDWNRVAEWAAGLTAATVAAIWISLGDAIWILLALMVLDTLSGVFVAGKAGKIDSTVGYLGWRRKVLTLILVMAVAIAQPLLGDFLKGAPLGQMVAGGFCGVELLSIAENAGLAGVRVGFLTKLFGKLRDRLDGGGEEGGSVVPHG